MCFRNKNGSLFYFFWFPKSWYLVQLSTFNFDKNPINQSKVKHLASDKNAYKFIIAIWLLFRKKINISWFSIKNRTSIWLAFLYFIILPFLLKDSGLIYFSITKIKKANFWWDLNLHPLPRKTIFEACYYFSQDKP